VNLLARNIYALTRDEALSESDTLTASELSSLELLAKLRQTTPTTLSESWGQMAEYGWYPVIDQLETTPSEEA
jgi:hypothetical protein